MKDTAIVFKSVSKLYRLGQISHGMLFKDLQSYWAKFLGKEDPNSYVKNTRVTKNNLFWALRDINFSVKKGEVVGIIGRNGAGKSTLLKILSRITSPTDGSIIYQGRIASLLEVGTGFHPELTGKENIYLNGAILGMTRNEILQKYDEIVDFSGISEFIDTPVKRYSSGMYVRLAFAVAAHLSPDILVIDEVLAVGDLDFQKKCLGKMESVSKESGRTILFVSHNMAAISSLCNRSILLKDGMIHFIGNTADTIRSYIQENERILNTSLIDRKDRTGEGEIIFTETWTEDATGEKKNIFLSGETLVICAKIKFNQKVNYKKLRLAFQIQDHNDYTLTDLKTESKGIEFKTPIIQTEAVFKCRIDRLPFMPGLYNHHVIIWSDQVVQDFIITAGKFQVEEGDFFNTGKNPHKGHGYLLLDHNWIMI